ALYDVYDLNVRAAVQVTQAFIPAMKARQAGRIVNICSRVVHGAYDRTSYSAAKSALLGCSYSWALELAPYGITVNAVSPGPAEPIFIRKGHHEGSETEHKALSSIPMGRFAQPDHGAHAVLCFLSDEARYITGQELGVDGGGELAGR